MWKTKAEAFRLRRLGQSYSEISQELKIPKGTLGGWFKNEPWSREIRDRLSSEISLANPAKLKLMAEANRARWRRKHEEYRSAAIQEFYQLRDIPLFLAGVMLYWGEGERQSKSSVVRLGNSEPEMMRIYYLFLTKVLKINPDKIHARLLLYPDLVDSVQKNFWSKATGIPSERFKKSVYITGRHSINRLSYGVCTVVVSSRALKERMLKWLELYQDFLRSSAFEIEK